MNSRSRESSAAAGGLDFGHRFGEMRLPRDLVNGEVVGQRASPCTQRRTQVPRRLAVAQRASRPIRSARREHGTHHILDRLANDFAD